MIKFSSTLLKYLWYVSSLFTAAIAFAYYTEGKIDNYKILIVLAMLFVGDKIIDSVANKLKTATK